MTLSKRHDPIPVGQPYRGIYSHGVETAAGVRTLHISGQVGVSAAGDLPSDFEGQCRQALENVEAVLEAADMSKHDIVKMCFFLVRREDMEALLNVRMDVLKDVRPAVTALYVAGLVSKDWLIEIDVVACAP
ncbi:MAG: RidA family protein [Pseudomonadota bacterium]